MKRSTALLLAMATLLAHILTLQQDARGILGPPEERAHIAFRLGRNLIQDIDGSWNVGGGFVDAYPSPGWILLAAAAELFRLPPTLVAQGMALVCALGVVIVVSRFSPDRLAGVMAPFLCVTSGVLAAAAGGGTELTAFAMVWCASLLALEAGRRHALTLFLCTAVLLRPEGLLLTLALLTLSLASRSRRRRIDEPLPGQARVPLKAFASPLVLVAAFCALRAALGGGWISPTAAEALQFDPERVRAGLNYLGDFALRAGFPLLVALPLLMFPRGLSARGRRALVMGLAWCAWVAWNGGDRLPLWTMLAPAIPPLAVAIQEALVVWIDGRSAAPRAAAWVLFFLGLGGSALASRQPGDLGPIRIAEIQRRWQDPSHSPLPRLYASQPGRAGKLDALRRDERLRAIGVFVRDALPQSASILTPWPGAIGYLSRHTTYDLFGRTGALPGEPGPRSHFGPMRTDLLAALAQEPDYLVLTLLDEERPPAGRDLVDDWLTQLDERGDEPGRRQALLDALRAFELITVPVPKTSDTLDSVSDLPLYILRARSLGQQPTLKLRGLGEGRFTVSVQHQGHLQLADLEILAMGSDGRAYTISPPGEFVSGSQVHARTDIQLFPTGDKFVQLFSGQTPPDLDIIRVSAVLRNPGSQDEPIFSGISGKVRLDL